MPKQTFSVTDIRKKLREVLDVVIRMPDDHGIAPLLRRCLIRLSKAKSSEWPTLH